MRLVLGFLSLLVGQLGFSQKMAVTDTGEKVVLYTDGRWAFAGIDTIRSEEITTNPNVFAKGKNADFLLKSTRIDVGFWLDPKTWTFNAREDNQAAEYELDHKNGSLYGLVITEHLDIPLSSLGNIALQNARDAAPDVEVVSKEYRMVNGHQVLMMRMIGTIQDIRFSYYGYYFSDHGYAVQFLVYSSEAYMEENLQSVEELLNGFVDLKK